MSLSEIRLLIHRTHYKMHKSQIRRVKKYISGMQATFSTLCLLTGFVLQSTKRQTIVCSSSATQKHPSSIICGVLVKNCLISSSNLINRICPFYAIEFLHCSLLWWGTVKSLLISHSCYNSITHHGVMAVLHIITSGKSRGFNK